MEIGKLQNDVLQNPARLQRLLTKTTVIASITIILLSAYGFYRVFSGFVIANAKDDSIRICTLLIDQHKQYLFHSPINEPIKLVIHDNDQFNIDQAMRRMLRPLNIVKVKIYDATRRIAFSTDTKIIGMSDSANRRLENALQGNIDARLETKDKVMDLSEEQLLDVDVVETYVPIKAESGEVVGCFEIYMNVTRYREQVRQGVIVMSSVLVLVMFGVFGFAYRLVDKGARQLREAQARLENMAVTDMLTDIANRGYLMVRGQEEYERIRRNRLRSLRPTAMGCIMLDLDHFKSINDTRGHQAGDDVLREVARRLKSSVRPYDVIGRYGGEEFVVLLPDTSFEQSLAVAERIRLAVREELSIGGGVPLQVTISLGVSCSNENDHGLSDLIARADEGLYKAKHSGRDRVAWVYHPFDSELHG